MKRSIVLAAVMTAALSVSSMSAFAAAKLTTDSTMGELIDNKDAKAILDKHLPGMSDNPQMEQARPMSLKALQQFAPNVTDEKLKAVDEDLAKLK